MRNQIYSECVHEEKKILYEGWIQIKEVKCHSKYLGIPTLVGQSRQQVFNFVQNRVWKKFKGWKGNHMSFATREILIKVVVQSIGSLDQSFINGSK
jgi:hypothetical protein